MCGIGCVKIKKLTASSRRKFELLLSYTEERGQDAFGIVNIKPDGRKVILKHPTKFSEVYISKAWDDYMKLAEVGDIFIWNCRAQPLTEVSSFDDNTIQPIMSNNLIITHNGVVANDKELIKDEQLEPKTKIDSEIPLLLYEKYGSVQETFKRCSGGFAYILYDLLKEELHLIKDFKTFVWGETDELFFAVSEEAFVKNIFPKFSWRHIEPYSEVIISFAKNTTNFKKIETKQISNLPASNNNKILVCASGGIDSTVAAFVAKRIWKMDVVLCHIDHGQKSVTGEHGAILSIAEALLSPYIRIELDWLGALGASVLTDWELDVPKASHQNLKSTICWTPARNLVMISALIATAEATGAKWITAGWTLEEEGSYPDNSILFFHKFNELTDYGTLMRPKLVMPLERLMKTEIIQLGKHLGVPFNLTYSCDNKPLSGKACGICGACTLRRMAFEKAEIEDTTIYMNDWKEQYKPPWLDDKVRPLKRKMREIKKRIIMPPGFNNIY